MFWFLRKSNSNQSVTVGTTEGTSTELDVRNYAGGTVTVSAGITTLTFYFAHETGDTHLPYYNKDDTAVTLTVASTKATQLPTEIYDMSFVKVVGNTTGTAIFSLKS